VGQRKKEKRRSSAKLHATRGARLARGFAVGVDRCTCLACAPIALLWLVAESHARAPNLWFGNARGHARPAWRVLTDGPSRSNCFSAYQTSLKVPQPLFPLHTLGIRSRQFEFYLKSVAFECAGTGTRRLRLSARKVERFLLSRFTSPLLAQLRLLPSFRSIR
jgi:hypothetical protein